MGTIVLLEGWTHPTLAHFHGIWVIWSDEQKVFVPLEKASAALVATCPGAGNKLKELDCEPF